MTDLSNLFSVMSSYSACKALNFTCTCGDTLASKWLVDILRFRIPQWLLKRVSTHS